MQSANGILLRADIKAGGFSLNCLKRILAKGTPKTYASKRGMRDLIRYQGWGILSKLT